jgi:hypothetical protein
MGRFSHLTREELKEMQKGVKEIYRRIEGMVNLFSAR